MVVCAMKLFIALIIPLFSQCDTIEFRFVPERKMPRRYGQKCKGVKLLVKSVRQKSPKRVEPLSHHHQKGA
jgi:hypothetical protein